MSCFSFSTVWMRDTLRPSELLHLLLQLSGVPLNLFSCPSVSPMCVKCFVLDVLGSTSHSLAVLNEGFFFVFLSCVLFYKAGIDECRESGFAHSYPSMWWGVLTNQLLRHWALSSTELLSKQLQETPICKSVCQTSFFSLQATSVLINLLQQRVSKH